MKVIIGFALFLIGVFWYGKSQGMDEEWQNEKDYWSEYFKNEKL